MKKERLRLEYAFRNVSLSLLWNTISTPAGLQSWFADDVRVSGQVYTFTWKKQNQDAELVSVKNLSHIRFHWMDDELPDSYFEFLIHISPLTNQTILEIIDYNSEEEVDEMRHLWDSQVEYLKRKLGVI